LIRRAEPGAASVATRLAAVVLRRVARRARRRAERTLPRRPHHSQHLDRIVDTFFAGYESALDLPVAATVYACSRIEPSLQGFAFEGAAMAATMLDVVAAACDSSAS
jgi:hypothetical protein